MSHTVTKEIKAELQAFADRITPPTSEPGAPAPGKGLTGAELQERYGITTDKSGSPLQEGKVYVARDMPAVNQLRRLCKAYERGGWPAVEQYLLPFRTPAAIARQAAEAAAEAPVFAPLPEASAELRTSEPLPLAGLPLACVSEAVETAERRAEQPLLRQAMQAGETVLFQAPRPCAYEAGAHTCPCPTGCSNAAPAA